MPYPFAAMPSFEELLKILEDEYDCALGQIDNDSFPLTYLERTVDGEKCSCPIHISDKGDIVTPTVLSYIGRRLKVDPTRFGLALGYLPSS